MYGMVFKVLVVLFFLFLYVFHLRGLDFIQKYKFTFDQYGNIQDMVNNNLSAKRIL